MIIKILNKEYPIHIGLDFIAEMDKVYKQEFGNVKFGFGVGTLLLELSQYNAVALARAIMAGTSTQMDQPSYSDIEAHLIQNPMAVHDLCENFMDALAENSLTMAQISQMGIVGSVLKAQQDLKNQESENPVENLTEES